MLNPTWRHLFLAWVEQQKPIVVLLPSFEEKLSSGLK
jgi:hypothetical protein